MTAYFCKSHLTECQTIIVLKWKLKRKDIGKVDIGIWNFFEGFFWKKTRKNADSLFFTCDSNLTVWELFFIFQMNFSIRFTCRSQKAICGQFHQRFTCTFFIRIFCQSQNITRKSCRNYIHTKNAYIKMLMKLTSGKDVQKLTGNIKICFDWFHSSTYFLSCKWKRTLVLLFWKLD